MNEEEYEVREKKLGRRNVLRLIMNRSRVERVYEDVNKGVAH